MRATSGTYQAPDPGKLSRPLEEYERSLKVAKTPNGRWMVMLGFDKIVRLFDLHVNDPATSPAIVLQGRQHDTVLPEISADSRWLVTANSDNVARAWDLQARKYQAPAHVFRGHGSTIRQLVVSSDSRWLVTRARESEPSGRFVTRLWQLGGEDPVPTMFQLEGHERGIQSVAIGPESRWLATEDDQTARLWDLMTDDPADASLAFQGEGYAIRSVSISPDGRWLVTSTDDNTIRDLKIDSLIDRARRLAGRELTAEERKQYLLEGI